MTAGNGNLDRYLGLLVDSVNRIEGKLDKLSDEHSDHKDAVSERIRAIEMKQAADEGAKKATSGIWGAVGGGVTAIIALIAQNFINPRY